MTPVSIPARLGGGESTSEISLGAGLTLGHSQGGSEQRNCLESSGRVLSCPGPGQEQEERRRRRRKRRRRRRKGEKEKKEKDEDKERERRRRRRREG